MSDLPEGYTLHEDVLARMDAITWGRLSRLRQDVFIVEQDCPYPDQDGRDEEPETVQMWATDAGGAVAATLRILREPDGAARRIGRVATATGHRGRGLMGALMVAAMQRCAGETIELEAQAHLQAWYERFGFTRVGDEFLEDGIPHVPMRFVPEAAAAPAQAAPRP